MASAALALSEEPQDINPEIRQAVLEQLDRIREDKLFRDTTRMKRFLSYVVNETLDGNSDLLKGYTIGLEVFDKTDDFDPQANTIVRVQAGQLRRRLELYYGSTGLRDPVRIIIPKGQYAPVFEMRRERFDEFPLELASVKASLDDISDKPHSDARPGIAVFTFNDLSGPDQSNYFAKGLTAEIVNALVQFRYLRIVARMPTVEHSGENVDLKRFAEDYDVQFILNGTVRRSGDILRVSVDLLSTETGEHVFSRIFDKKYSADNIFKIQEEIASHTAAKVAAPFGVVNRFNGRVNAGRRANLSAYESFMKFYELKLSPSAGKVRTLLKEFETLTEAQDGFSSAWAIRSQLNTFLCTLSMPSDARIGRLDDAIEFGNKAAAIDPDNALAFMSLFQAHYHTGDLEISEKMAKRSIALNPNDYAMLSYYALTNAFQGESTRAISYQKAAMRLIDRSPAWFYTSGLVVAFQAQRFQEIRDMLVDVSINSPVGSQIMYTSILGHLGEVESADIFLRKARERHTNYDTALSEIFSVWRPNATLRELVFKGWRLAGLDFH